MTSSSSPSASLSSPLSSTSSDALAAAGRAVRTGRVLTVAGLLAVAAAYARAISFTGHRGGAGAGAEDHVRARALGVVRLPGVQPRGYLQWALPLAGRPQARHVFRGFGRSGRRADRPGAHHRADLGQADLGHLVAMGTAPHLDPVPLLPVRGIPDAAHGRCSIRPSARATARWWAYSARCWCPSSTSASTCSARSIHGRWCSIPRDRRCRVPSWRRCSSRSAAFTLLYLGLVTMRYGLGRLRELREARDVPAA